MLRKNENDSHDIICIVTFIRSSVPEDKNGKILTPLLFFGDLLTVEGEVNAIEDRRNSTTSRERLEGIIPCLSDFHFLGNFLVVSFN